MCPRKKLPILATQLLYVIKFFIIEYLFDVLIFSLSIYCNQIYQTTTSKNKLVSVIDEQEIILFTFNVVLIESMEF